MIQLIDELVNELLIKLRAKKVFHAWLQTFQLGPLKGIEYYAEQVWRLQILLMLIIYNIIQSRYNSCWKLFACKL